MKVKKTPASQRPPQASTPAKQPRDSLPWRSLEQQVVRMQKQIAQASQRGDKQAVYDLQQRLMESEAARLLAVRRAAEENQGKDTAGVDGIKSLSPKERLVMASTIHPKYWNYQPPMPVRRVWVPKPGTVERRPLAILPMIDRCKQALVKLALEPEWEARFEAHSYGFRPGRSVHDAIAAIVVAIERQPMFVFDADIAEAFDHVNQAVVLGKLQTYPALRQVIDAWLTAGVMDGATWSPSEKGIAQGGVLSPLLMNVALHGMEGVVTESAAGGHAREQPLLVRYADNFVMLHPDLNELQQAVRRVRRWLARMGLHLHPDKTRFTHTLTPYQGQVGFDFLGFYIRQEIVDRKGASEVERNGRIPVPQTGFPQVAPHPHRMGRKAPARGPTPLHSTPASTGSDRAFTIPTWVSTLRLPLHEMERDVVRLRRLAPHEHSLKMKTIITPSQEASKRHLAAIDQRLQQLQTASQAQVIAELNPLIIGWAAYYNGVVPPATLTRYDDLLEQRLIKWASKRHPGKARDWLLARYWQRTGKQKRVFATPEGVQLRTYRQASILRG